MKHFAVALFTVVLCGCIGDDNGSTSTGVLSTAPQVISSDQSIDLLAWNDRVCEAPLFTNLLGVWEGRFDRRDSPTGPRGCVWEATLTITGQSMGLACLTTGVMDTEVVEMLEDSILPYECADYDGNFAIPDSGSVDAFAELVLPQDFTWELQSGSLPELNEDGTVGNYYPISEVETFTIDENYFIQFEHGTFERVGDI